MKRSEIEAAVRTAREAFEQAGIALPPFADWSKDQWKAAADSHAARARLGWDVTDYGRGAFAERGLLLFTMRNGLASELAAGRGFSYAEKIMYVGDGQITPMHRHNTKVEDIIVRGDGTLVLELRKAKPDGSVGEAGPVTVLTDGVERTTDAKGMLRLTRGESVTLTPDIWHAFWGEGGAVVVGEVSSVNDDATDNVFTEPLPRFPTIEEDAPATVPLVFEH